MANVRGRNLQHQHFHLLARGVQMLHFYRVKLHCKQSGSTFSCKIGITNYEGHSSF